jgi:hypothetical protein
MSDIETPYISTPQLCSEMAEDRDVNIDKLKGDLQNA